MVKWKRKAAAGASAFLLACTVTVGTVGVTTTMTGCGVVKDVLGGKTAEGVEIGIDATRTAILETQRTMTELTASGTIDADMSRDVRDKVNLARRLLDQAEAFLPGDVDQADALLEKAKGEVDAANASLGGEA